VMTWAWMSTVRPLLPLMGGVSSRSEIVGNRKAVDQRAGE
jgi:hypothetical protein